MFGCRENAEKIPQRLIAEGKMKFSIIQSKIVGEQFPVIFAQILMATVH